MKKLYLLLVACLISITGFGQSGTTGPLTWTLRNDTLTISGTGAMPDYTGSNHPWPTTIKQVIIEDGVTRIGNGAFFSYSGITSVTIPNSVTSIGSTAFANCTGLTSATIPNSITNIDWYTFSGCTGLTSATIPNSVTSVGFRAFEGCTSLTSVSIPGSVTSIGESAFQNCTGLTSVTLPGSVTSFGIKAFYGCTSLTFVSILDGVTSIGEHAFERCTGLTSVSIPKSVTIIGNSAFSGCEGLTSVWIADGVTKIGDAAFSGSGLTSVVIPGSVINIGKYAFEYCRSLTSVTIPGSVTSIGMRAFQQSKGLTSVYTDQSSPIYINSLTFSPETFQICNLYVPKGSASLYAQATGWSDFKNISEMGLSVSSSQFIIGKEEASTATSIVTSSTSWTATSNQDWLTVSPASGTGNGTLTFIAEQNTALTERSATVTLAATDVNPVAITITQAGDAILSASSSQLAIGKEEASTVTSIVTSNTSWTASSNDDWLTVSPVSGAGNATLTFTTKQNTAVAQRTATVILATTGVNPVTITITQQPGDALLSVSSSQLEISKEEASTATSLVTSNTSWTASSNDDWLTVSPVSGTGNATLTFTTKQNTAVTQRTATVTLAATGTNTVSITITQQPEDAFIIAAQSLPLNGGIVTGVGEYARNTPVSLQAISNDQYEFKGWKENTTIITDAITYNFTAIVSRTLYAVFSPKENADTSMIITPQSSSASFVWSPVNGASSYQLIIYSDASCTQEAASYQIDASGEIINKSASTTETYASTILSCSIDALSSGKIYYYLLTSYDINGQALSVSSGNFNTLITGTNEVDAVVPKVYPTPTTGMAYIVTTNNNVPSIKVYNIQGRLLFQTKGNEVDLSNCANGMYLLQIDGQTIKVEKK
jgi:hypothetical protein